MAVTFIKTKQQQARDGLHLSLSGQMVIGLLFLVALLAFEIFNFDTTQYALENLLGTVSFAGLRWATVLAIAFCAIDFAGLVRFFLPEEQGKETPVEVWYLMGAWLLGATMNALMTWWAVSLTLLDHDLGNEVLSRQQLLEIVPVFVAVLVWLTRILFIGAFTVAGGFLFDVGRMRPARKVAQPATRPRHARPQRQPLARPTPLPAGLRPVAGPEKSAVFARWQDARDAEADDEAEEQAAAGRPRLSRPASRPQPVPVAAESVSGHGA
ncbi:MAG: hypothetical protein RRC07_09640 [Anaerolineae bacterium]|nr:hypothetical protein [Anaerolineae bacterium]